MDLLFLNLHVRENILYAHTPILVLGIYLALLSLPFPTLCFQSIFVLAVHDFSFVENKHQNKHNDIYNKLLQFLCFDIIAVWRLSLDLLYFISCPNFYIYIVMYLYLYTCIYLCPSVDLYF